ncbi:L-threonylcarbamoyladenylate synthase [Celeribacter indicus]|uniref:L-threonylcarbamoyladenylate synthase n=1 Tax=Celeribacter indicus TaxID=1208324 RepID=A0A0B5E185_9RHOB|nr:L-threonylcarbamoyladenylate synthase [Celeribacter indicus]AJE46202.1 sua5/ycio/yrdc/ywlc family protein [Celeribacter indicus]SDW49867.1 L-threonylcarbamoyladenylate synthase [Celeribacter indicus]
MTHGVAEIARCLTEGGVVLLPTDTVLGLAVSPARSDAVDRLYALKMRPRDKNLPVMVADAGQIAALGAEIPPAADALLASRFVPGALTLVFGLDQTRAPGWLAGRAEIAVRIPDDARLLAVLRETGPLLVTSANRSGAETPATTVEAAAQLAGAPDMTVPGSGSAAAPSTIVNCRLSPVKIERHGAIPAAEIAALTGAVQ